MVDQVLFSNILGIEQSEFNDDWNNILGFNNITV